MEQMEQAPSYPAKDKEFLAEIAQKFGPNSPQYREFLKVVEQERISNKFGLKRSAEKEKPLLSLVREVIKIIDSVELEKPTKKTAKLLEAQKQEAKENIKKLLELAVKYVDKIDQVQQVNAKADKLEPKDYRRIYEEADKNRRLVHNALFDQAAITSRYILLHFGEINEKQQEKFEEQEEKAGREILDVRRKKFPPNLLWPEKVNLNSRESVGDWAMLISRELADTGLENL